VIYTSEYPRFSDFAEESKSFEGDKKKIEDILNKEILILDFKIKDSKQRQNSLYVTIQFRMDDNTFIVFTGSTVLINQLEKYKENLPFFTVIKRIDKYYTLS
jgi:ribosomal protein S8